MRKGINVWIFDRSCESKKEEEQTNRLQGAAEVFLLLNFTGTPGLTCWLSLRERVDLPHSCSEVPPAQTWTRGGHCGCSGLTQVTHLSTFHTDHWGLFGPLQVTGCRLVCRLHFPGSLSRSGCYQDLGSPPGLLPDLECRWLSARRAFTEPLAPYQQSGARMLNRLICQGWLRKILIGTLQISQLI